MNNRGKKETRKGKALALNRQRQEGNWKKRHAEAETGRKLEQVQAEGLNRQ